MRLRDRRLREMHGPKGMVIRPVDREDSPWDSNMEDEALFWPRVLWIDPGKVSGVACVWLDPVGLESNWPLPRCVLATMSGYLYGAEVGQAKAFINLAALLDEAPGLAVGVESFILGQFNLSPDLLSPVRIRAMLDFHFATDGRELWAQSASDAKTSVTDARLRLWGLYESGPDHIRDAMRHCLLWAKKIRGHSRADIARVHGSDPEWWTRDEA